jgi:hypothetical protein
VVDKITSTILIGSLPNEPPQVILTENIKTSSQFCTQKILEEKTGNIFDQDLNSFDNVSSKNTSHFSSKVV